MFNDPSDPFADIFAPANHRQLLKLGVMHVLLEILSQLLTLFFWASHPWNKVHTNNGAIKCKLFKVGQEVLSAVRL